MRRPHQLLLGFRQVAAKEFGAGGSSQARLSATSTRAEDVRRVLVELVLHGLARVGRDRRDIDEADDAIVRPRAGDGGAAVGVADEQDRAADAVERPLHGRQILFVASRLYCTAMTS